MGEQNGNFLCKGVGCVGKGEKVGIPVLIFIYGIFIGWILNEQIMLQNAPNQKPIVFAHLLL